jgi:hypothetical protein
MCHNVRVCPDPARYIWIGGRDSVRDIRRSRSGSVNWEVFSRYCPIELAVAENTLFALPPINRSVPTTITKMTASITAYSAISCPSSCDQSLPRKSVTFAPPRASILLLVKNRFRMKHSLLVWRTERGLGRIAVRKS